MPYFHIDKILDIIGDIVAACLFFLAAIWTGLISLGCIWARICMYMMEVPDKPAVVTENEIQEWIQQSQPKPRRIKLVPRAW